MEILNLFRPCKAVISAAEASRDTSEELSESIREFTHTMSKYMEQTKPPQREEDEQE